MGERIRFERERLRLSQGDFAMAAGISRTTQIHYEKGRHVPDAHYLAGLEAAGADLRYVLFGTRSSTVGASATGNRVLPLLAKRARINYTSLLAILELAEQDKAEVLFTSGPESSVIPDEKWDALVAALFYKEGSLLRQVLLGVSQVLDDAKVETTAAREVDLILGLHETFKGQRRVGKRALESALRAAAYDVLTARDNRPR